MRIEPLKLDNRIYYQAVHNGTISVGNTMLKAFNNALINVVVPYKGKLISSDGVAVSEKVKREICPRCKIIFVVAKINQKYCDNSCKIIFNQNKRSRLTKQARKERTVRELPAKK